MTCESLAGDSGPLTYVICVEWFDEEGEPVKLPFQKKVDPWEDKRLTPEQAALVELYEIEEPLQGTLVRPHPEWPREERE